MYPFETQKINDTRNMFVVLAFLFGFLVLGSGICFAANTIALEAIHPQTNERSIYVVNISLDQEILPTAKILVTFPANFDLTEVIIAGSTTINGGFELLKEKSTVILKRSGLGRVIKHGEKVDVKFANVRNPSTPADNYTIKVEIQNTLEAKAIGKECRMKISAKALD
jgi:hypothetical protein